MFGWGQAGRLAACATLAFSLVCVAASARAEVRVEGDEAALRLTADNASLGDVLAALKSKFRLRYDESLRVDREVTGTLNGTLHRVVVRLLDGYDFVVKRSAADGVEIIRVTEPGRAHTAAQPRAFMWRAAFTKTASSAATRTVSTASRLPRN